MPREWICSGVAGTSSFRRRNGEEATDSGLPTLKRLNFQPITCIHPTFFQLFENFVQSTVLFGRLV